MGARTTGYAGVFDLPGLSLRDPRTHFRSLLGEKDTKMTSSSKFPQDRELRIEILLTEAVYSVDSGNYHSGLTKQ